MNDRILFDSYLIKRKILCNGYVTIRLFDEIKLLIFNSFLCNGYVTNNRLYNIKLLKNTY
jgi:hypothetical protein